MISKKNKFTKLFVWLLAFSFVMPIFSGCGAKPVSYSVDLEIWGISDNLDDYQGIISKYKEINPFVGDIVYKKFTVDNYKKDILNALASGNGPDIFMINNSWISDFEDKIVPAPSYLANEQEFRSNFVDVVVDDFLGSSGEIYGAPLSVNSLVLFYNKDLFNAAGITSPPATWEEVVEDSKKITQIDDIGGISRSGIALGTPYNINRSSDIIDLLLFQHGAKMPSRMNKGFNAEYNVGTDVLEFYTQFSRSSSPAYSWNSSMHYSIDAFYEGDLAMMINYSWHIETLKNKNAKLNFAVAPVPQLLSDRPANYANYWSFVVNKNKEVKNKKDTKVLVTNDDRIHEAWGFLKFMTFKNNGTFTVTNIKSKNQKSFNIDIDPAEDYANKTKNPSARRDLVEKQKIDPILGPSAYGNLIAKSWYRKDSEAVENVWAEIIDSINRGDITASEGFNLAKSRINEITR